MGMEKIAEFPSLFFCPTTELLLALSCFWKRKNRFLFVFDFLGPSHENEKKTKTKTIRFFFVSVVASWTVFFSFSLELPSFPPSLPPPLPSWLASTATIIVLPARPSKTKRKRKPFFFRFRCRQKPGPVRRPFFFRFRIVFVSFSVISGGQAQKVPQVCLV